MVRKLLVSLSVATMLVAASPALAVGCKGCAKVANDGHGFCCGKGKAFGVEVTSKKLLAALAGREVSAAEAQNCPCADCKKAVAGKGSCDRCKFTGGKLYKSPVAFQLAKGQPMSQGLIAACPERCAQCKTAFKQNALCKQCKAGFVAGRMFTEEKAYSLALAAWKTLKKAASAALQCEQCAVALVTDGTCARCKVNFKNGNLVRSDG